MTHPTCTGCDIAAPADAHGDVPTNWLRVELSRNSETERWWCCPTCAEHVRDALEDAFACGWGTK
jgi:phage baseplate assembly protein gpV